MCVRKRSLLAQSFDTPFLFPILYAQLSIFDFNRFLNDQPNFISQKIQKLLLIYMPFKHTQPINVSVRHTLRGLRINVCVMYAQSAVNLLCMQYLIIGNHKK